MSTQSEQSEQSVWGVPSGPLPIFDHPNCVPPVLLPPPVHGSVTNFWKVMLHPIKPLAWQEAIVQLAEASHHQRGVEGGGVALAQQEAIVQLAEARRHQCNVEGGGVSSCAIENISGESVPVTSRI